MEATYNCQVEREGAFGWIRRMGIHEAYHRSTLNRWVHWLCIPFELFAVVAFGANVPLPAGADLAIVLIIALAPLYLATDVLLGGIFVAMLVGLWALAGVVFPTVTVWSVVAPVAIFATTFTVQLRIGHAIGEQGRDDTPMNLFCFGETRDPLPLLLIFYYHLVELAFAAGYRPGLRRSVEAATQAELQRLDLADA